MITLPLILNLLLNGFALVITILAFFAFQQLQLLNTFLKTPLAHVLNLLALLFFLASLATLVLTAWTSLSS